MPLYVYDCPKCGTFEQFRSLADRQSTNCPSCNSISQKRPFTIVQRVKEFWPYYDHAMGKTITSRREREAEIKKRGLVELSGRDPDFSKPKPKPIDLGPNRCLLPSIEVNSRR